jgi:hypothetical protein
MAAVEQGNWPAGSNGAARGETFGVGAHAEPLVEVQGFLQAGGAFGGAALGEEAFAGAFRRISLAAGGMIAKTFFLAKIIHRIGTRSLRGKKSLPEN